MRKQTIQYFRHAKYYMRVFNMACADSCKCNRMPFQSRLVICKSCPLTTFSLQTIKLVLSDTVLNIESSRSYCLHNTSQQFSLFKGYEGRFHQIICVRHLPKNYVPPIKSFYFYSHATLIQSHQQFLSYKKALHMRRQIS